jgi:hypothetical protein
MLIEEGKARDTMHLLVLTCFMRSFLLGVNVIKLFTAVVYEWVHLHQGQMLFVGNLQIFVIS